MTPLPSRFDAETQGFPEKIEGFEDCTFMFNYKDQKTSGLIWMNHDEAALLWKAVKTRPPGTNMVEIGRCEGGSTLLMGAAKGPDHDLVSLDIDPVNDKQLEGMIDSLGLRFIHLLTADGSKYPAYAILNIGLVFIDGDHQYESIKADYENWFPEVIEGGLIVFHDVRPDCVGPWKFYQELLAGDEVEPVAKWGSLAVMRKR